MLLQPWFRAVKVVKRLTCTHPGSCETRSCSMPYDAVKRRTLKLYVKRDMIRCNKKWSGCPVKAFSETKEAAESTSQGMISKK